MSDLSKLIPFLLRFTAQTNVSGAGLAWKNGMCCLIARQGPEGRRLNVSPVRKGWDIDGTMIPSAVGAALYRSATKPNFAVPGRGTILSQ